MSSRSFLTVDPLLSINQNDSVLRSCLNISSNLVSAASSVNSISVRRSTEQYILPIQTSKEWSTHKCLLLADGFTRINSGPDTGGYYHELFLKDRPTLSIHICRVGIPQATPRRRGVKAHDSMNTPDFYSMPAITLHRKSIAALP